MRNKQRVPQKRQRTGEHPRGVQGRRPGTAPSSASRRRVRSSRRSSGKFFWLFIAVLLLIALSALWTLRKQAKETADLQASLEGLQKQKQKLEEEVSDLESQLSIVNTDDFIEKYAHENLGMLKPNELIMEVESTRQTEADDSEETSNSSKTLPEKSEEAPEESTDRGD